MYMNRNVRKAALTVAVASIAAMVCGAAPRKMWWVEPGQGRTLVYQKDDQGNRVPDFSYCGYMGGGVAIPDAAVKAVVTPVKGDATARLQAAIDYVTSLPADEKGIKGAVLVKKGTYEVGSQLVISGSGVVLRGEGMDATTIVATGHDRRMLIRVLGKPDITIDRTIDVTDQYVPVGAYSFSVSDANSLKTGDMILITRPSSVAWLAALSEGTRRTEQSQWWRPGSRDIIWDRVITKIDGNRLTVDAPITTAIEMRFGGATVSKYDWPDRVSQAGVENLTLDTSYDKGNPVDEAHAWVGITMENTANAWVRQVAFKHFSGGAVQIWETCKHVTVEDCKSTEPVSENGGFRRHTFLTGGQMTLFLRCWSENGRHDFTTWYCAAGPNAFVWCQAKNALEDSGPMFSWASGVLFDNVKIDGARLSLTNRMIQNAGVGWAAANCMLWNCTSAEMNCWNPPTAHNWANGCWSRFIGDGEWGEVNDYSSIRSLYQQQLAERLGGDAARHIYGIEYPGGSTSPTYEMNEQMVAASNAPAEQVIDLVNEASRRNPIPADSDDVESIDKVLGSHPELVKAGPSRTVRPLKLENGWLTVEGSIATGSMAQPLWWRGNTPPTPEDISRPGVVRFVPGRIGPGYTDDLEQVTDTMVSRGQRILNYHYALWQERRRDDHERIRRMDGDVWPPFYELPFARSGQGTMWNGLSKYDLTKYDKWYWLRMKQFADLCDTKGLVVFNQNYFQHNIIEAGAHWADFPWRSANNINNTGFPEPPPYVANDKRVVQSHLFYDVNQPVRRELHKAYIRQCLSAFADNSNVIQFTSEEFTGPLHFVQFWLDVIAEWEKETGKHPLIALSCTKDVQDAILADPVRSKVVDIIDIKYWYYQNDGTPYAPKGGLNLAPRQHARILKPKPSSFGQVARAVNEYRAKYPGKAVIYSADGGNPLAVLMAGGSLAEFRDFFNPSLMKAIATMQPLSLRQTGGELILANPGKEYLVYCPRDVTTLDMTDAGGAFALKWVDMQGTAVDGGTIEGGSKTVELRPPTERTLLAWLVKK